MAINDKLEHEDGTPADPPTLHTAVPNWSAGDTIPLGRDRILRVARESASGLDLRDAMSAGRRQDEAAGENRRPEHRPLTRGHEAMLGAARRGA
jgi:hypothetical protein